MVQLGGECVFASEIDKFAIETYKENYGINADYDITKVKTEDIPSHDVLCGGFPCQSFSKAGKRLGFEDETRGTLFFEIERILKYHHPRYIILENVRNFASHDKGRTWRTIEEHLHKIGYRLTKKPLIVSPHHFGTPQLRERVIILGLYQPNNPYKPLDIDLGRLKTKNENSIYNILEQDVDEKYNITKDEEKILEMWDEFYKGIDLDIIGFPVWVEWLTKNAEDEPAKWRRKHIPKNNKLYKNNKEFIDNWLEKYDNLEWCEQSRQRLEWQCQGQIDTIWDGLIQIRPSGIRVKTPNCSPTIVAIGQIPIIGKYKRRLTLKEVARLQDFQEDFIPNKNEAQAYKQFGNAVNVKVIRKCAEKLFNYKDKDKQLKLI